MGKQPPGKKTMEVDISWLEDVPEVKKAKAEAKKGQKPPRMPGAAVTVPPLPVASSEPPRNTIPVKDEWLEVVDENPDRKETKKLPKYEK